MIELVALERTVFTKWRKRVTHMAWEVRTADCLSAFSMLSVTGAWIIILCPQQSPTGTGLPLTGPALIPLLIEKPRVGPPNLTQCTHPTTPCRGNLSHVTCPPSLQSSQGAHTELDKKEMQGHGM